ncbi:hypothetical protein DACRYDRAFT_117909 [Dacryopinax primogenitus]|uniref:F-box domain-containing protein n=1 Tax=Dacryopinax primogenitus (strain DJM 731) TaxID=1858805 RepID=M5FRH3_DACPD|nr:uncharacterized protein DACRYDRAFT_117909 [Dacryopinax primogenitus]EJT99730.1 hypothetical protein DACRYDRAFT_117909 [Dacryopinax primogenitus]
MSSSVHRQAVTLPFDISREIVSLITDQRDLSQLCLISSVMGELASKQLYNSISLYGLPTLVKLHRTLSRNAFLASQVSTLEINLDFYALNVRNRLLEDQDGSWCADKIIRGSAFLRLAFRILASLVKLRNLAIRWNLGMPGILISASAGFFRLPPGLISVESDTEDSWPVYDFVRSQPHLKYLVIYIDREGEGDVPSEMVDVLTGGPPHGLRSLVSNTHTVAALVPGRPVEEFRLTELISLKQLDRLLDHLKLSSGPLRVVELILEGADHETFSKICVAVPQVIELGVVAYYSQFHHFTSSQAMHAVEGLRQLQNLVISIPSKLLEVGPIQIANVGKNLCCVCPSLQRIEFSWIDSCRSIFDVTLPNKRFLWLGPDGEYTDMSALMYDTGMSPVT